MEQPTLIFSQSNKKSMKDGTTMIMMLDKSQDTHTIDSMVQKLGHVLLVKLFSQVLKLLIVQLPLMIALQH